MATGYDSASAGFYSDLADLETARSRVEELIVRNQNPILGMAL